MTKKRSIRRKLLLSLLIGCMIPYLIGGFYLKSYIENWTLENYTKQTHNLLEQVTEIIDRSLLENNSNLVSFLSEDPIVKNAERNLNNYLNYSVKDTKLASTAEQNLEKLFSNIKSSHPEVSYVFMGTEDGGYLEYPAFDPSESYDPRTRSWYQNAINKTDTVVNNPYISKVTKSMVISFSHPVLQGNNPVGVVGIALKIDDLTKTIGSISLGKSGYLAVLNDAGMVVINSQNSDWLLKYSRDLNINLLEISDNQTHSGMIGKVEKVANAHISPKSHWKVISIFDKKELLQESQIITNILMAIYLITLLIIAFVVTRTSVQISRPIEKISHALEEVSNNEFNNAHDEVLNTYSKLNDEIGLISRSYLNMKRKTQEYYTKISDNNTEITNRNEQLTASEEELIAQLEEIESQREHINFLAYHDPLTKLPNRRKFLAYLEGVIRNEQVGAVALLDLDNFKEINDTMGHVFGDRVLEIVASRLNSLASESVFISRFGGDEFLLLFLYPQETQLKKFVSTLFKTFDTKIKIHETELEIHFSMGISQFPFHSVNPDQLIMNSDLAMYSVKNSGKNNYAFFEPYLLERINKRTIIEAKLRDALKMDDFKLVYQPIVKLKTGETSYYEALLRFSDNQFSPADFIPIAEETGVIFPLGRLVFEKAVRQLSLWRSSGLEIKPVSINFSAKQIFDKTFIDFVDEVLDRYEIPSEMVMIEITETVFLNSKEATLDFIAALKTRKIKIFIDDFGTGYSSLGYLTTLPVDCIKLDKSLTDRLLDFTNVEIINSIIALARSLNMEVVAEGVELEEQVRLLKVGHCDYAQGYFFSKPIEASIVAENISRKYSI